MPVSMRMYENMNINMYPPNRVSAREKILTHTKDILRLDFGKLNCKAASFSFAGCLSAQDAKLDSDGKENHNSLRVPKELISTTKEAFPNHQSHCSGPF